MRLFPITTILITAAIASSARAGERESRERVARKACLTGNFTKGVDVLADLFLDTGDLNYIFNQGRCLEQNHRYEDAIARFREYLVKGTSLSSDARADAEKHIAACESYLGKVEPEKRKVEPERPAPVQEPARIEKPSPAAVVPSPALPPPSAQAGVVPPSAAQAAPANVTAAAPTSHRAGSGLRVGGIVSASGGVAALGAGVALNLIVNGMTSDLEKPYAYVRSTNSTRETYKTIGWIAYGVGGAALAAGAVLFAVGWSKGREPASERAVSIAPSLAPGSAGVTLGGAF
jgi:hypothetical protein